MTTKKCGSCKETLDVSMFYKKTASKDGLQGDCKVCQRYASAKYFRKVSKRRTYETSVPAEKKCTGPLCKGKILPASSFGKNRSMITGLQVYCKDCNKSVGPDREKHRVRCMTHRAVKSGKIEKQPCLWCGSAENLEAHHDSYEEGRELDVVWLCRKCHGSVHRILNLIGEKV